jgi:hypothetical protein
MRRNNGPADLDDLIRESQDRLNQIVRRVGSSKVVDWGGVYSTN